MKRKKTKNKSVKIGRFRVPALLIFFGLAILITNIVFSIEVSTLTAEIVFIEKEENQVISENRELSNEALKSSSLNGLYETASEMGFHKPSDVVYISKEEVVAKLP